MAKKRELKKMIKILQKDKVKLVQKVGELRFKIMTLESLVEEVPQEEESPQDICSEADTWDMLRSQSILSAGSDRPIPVDLLYDLLFDLHGRLTALDYVTKDLYEELARSTEEIKGEDTDEGI